jgi:hypothetical protein
VPSPSLWSGYWGVVGFSQVRPVAAGGSDDLDDGRGGGRISWPAIQSSRSVTSLGSIVPGIRA